MELQKAIDYCSAKPGVTQEFPFDETTLVFKVAGKMFALINLNPPYSINLKCDPFLAQTLRQEFPAVKPGYHMNKKHWNTIQFNDSIQDDLIFQWIDDSYQLVFLKLSKKIQSELQSDS